MPSQPAGWEAGMPGMLHNLKSSLNTYNLAYVYGRYNISFQISPMSASLVSVSAESDDDASGTGVDWRVGFLGSWKRIKEENFSNVCASY